MSDSMFKFIMKFLRKDFDPNLSLELIHLIDRAAEYYDAYAAYLNNRKDLENKLPNDPDVVKEVEHKLSWIKSEDRELIASRSYRDPTKDIVENKHLPPLKEEDRFSYSILDKFLIKEKCLGKPKNTFFGFILEPKDDRKTIYVVFRGTRDYVEWIKNTNFSQTSKDVSDGFDDIYISERR